MYKIKRFSCLSQKEYVKLGEARNKVDNQEGVCLGHIALFMGNKDGDRYDDHWPEEVTKFIYTSLNGFKSRVNKIKVKSLFPKFYSDHLSQSLITVIKNKLSEESASNAIRLLKLVKSDDFVNIIDSFLELLDDWIKLNRRPPVMSDKADIKFMLVSVRDRYYDILAEYKNW